jgi:hypothetical protein
MSAFAKLMDHLCKTVQTNKIDLYNNSFLLYYEYPNCKKKIWIF